MNTIDAHDDKTRRCPRLGHSVEFSYCRMPGNDIPCSMIFDCWWETFDVKKFMEKHYDAQTIESLLRPPISKVTSLVDLINQARERTRKNQGLPEEQERL